MYSYSLPHLTEAEIIALLNALLRNAATNQLPAPAGVVVADAMSVGDTESSEDEPMEQDQESEVHVQVDYTAPASTGLPSVGEAGAAPAPTSLPFDGEPGAAPTSTALPSVPTVGEPCAAPTSTALPFDQLPAPAGVFIEDGMSVEDTESVEDEPMEHDQESEVQAQVDYAAPVPTGLPFVGEPGADLNWSDWVVDDVLQDAPLDDGVDNVPAL